MSAIIKSIYYTEKASSLKMAMETRREKHDGKARTSSNQF
jgi:hypothetical protein